MLPILVMLSVLDRLFVLKTITKKGMNYKCIHRSIRILEVIMGHTNIVADSFVVSYLRCRTDTFLKSKMN